ncbi:unnamed protein product [Ectocarpus sp. 12 AP-2014]
MSARSKLDACIKGLEDSLGAPAALKDSIVGVPSATAPATALQLVESTIATLEASLGLSPGDVLTPADAKGTGGNTKRPTKGKEGVNKGERKKAGKAAASTAGVSYADQPDGTKVDLRVGQITRVWMHETADKLYCEEIDVGEGAPRNIASGLVPHYSLEEMKGRKVIVMCNLKPRNLKGFKSQGMVVCAVGALSDGKVFAVRDSVSSTMTTTMVSSPTGTCGACGSSRGIYCGREAFFRRTCGRTLRARFRGTDGEEESIGQNSSGTHHGCGRHGEVARPRVGVLLRCVHGPYHP